MAFVPFEDCVRVESRWLSNGAKPMEITLWGRKLSGSVDQSDVDAIADAFDAWAVAELKPRVNVGTTYVETYARDMTAEISYQAVNDDGTGAGTKSGTGCEDHTAIVVQRKSGLVGRKANGRIYGFGGVTADRLSQSRWTAAQVAAWEDAMTDSNTVWDGLGFLPVIASPTLRQSTGQVLLSTFEVLSWVASVDIAAVRARSRLP